MDDVIDAVERLSHGVVVAHVADAELDVRVEVARPGAAGMHLGIEVVERAHRVTAASSASPR